MVTLARLWFIGSADVLLLSLQYQFVGAMVIDNFNEGPIVLVDPSHVVQLDLDPEHVAGGAREIHLFEGGISVNAVAGEFAFDTPGYGFTLAYGTYGEPLALEPAAEGHDRIRLTFSEVSVLTPFLGNIYFTSDEGGSSIDWVDGLISLTGSGGILEIPFSNLGIDPTDIRSIVLSLNRFDTLSANTFVLNEIVSAATPLPGDYTRDGLVNDDDFQLWKSQFGKRSLRSSTSLVQILLAADGNENGYVDAADYTYWRDALTATGSGGSVISPAVPEPATGPVAGWLLLGGAVSMCQRRRSH